MNVLDAMQKSQVEEEIDMTVLLIKGWIKRFLRGVSDVLRLKGFSWQELGNTAIRETFLTVLFLDYQELT